MARCLTILALFCLLTERVPAAETRLLPLKKSTDQFRTPQHIQGAVEFQLHVSRDAGQNWEVVDRQPASARHFIVDPQQPGPHWYSASASMPDGRRQPAQLISQLQVEWDNTRPQIQLARQVSAAGWIDLECRVEDNRLGANHQLTIEYMLGNDPDWHKLEITDPPRQVAPGSLVCRTRWQPVSESRVIYLRATARDLSGNYGREFVTIFLPPQSLRRSVPPQASPLAPQSTPGATPWPPDNQVQAPPPAALNPIPPAGPLVDFDMAQVYTSTSRSFALNYRVDPARRLMRVQLWRSLAEQDNWHHFASDPDLSAPLLVHVDSDGLYRFQLSTTYLNPTPGGSQFIGETLFIWVRVETQGQPPQLP
jgi:hypothetical protein